MLKQKQPKNPPPNTKPQQYVVLQPNQVKAKKAFTEITKKNIMSKSKLLGEIIKGYVSNDPNERKKAADIHEKNEHLQELSMGGLVRSYLNSIGKTSNLSAEEQKQLGYLIVKRALTKNANVEKAQQNLENIQSKKTKLENKHKQAGRLKRFLLTRKIKKLNQNMKINF